MFFSFFRFSVIKLADVSSIKSFVGKILLNHKKRMAKIEGDRRVFPEGFDWGTATASFQIEGGKTERGLCIWDEFCEVWREKKGPHRFFFFF